MTELTCRRILFVALLLAAPAVLFLGKLGAGAALTVFTVAVLSHLTG